VSADSATPPIEFSETKNLKWSRELPGPGVSSPIVVGDRVIVTCWTPAEGEELEDDTAALKRHVLCFDRATGEEKWAKEFDAVQPEELYTGMFREHGYASHTPVSDGERIYVYFGKSGLLALDLDGNFLWQKSTGTESDPNGWGTAASPILYKDLVIVPATAESEALIAFNKQSGDEVWRQEAAGFSGSWSTPVLVDAGEGRQELVTAVPNEVWGLDPDTGKLRWYCEGVQGNTSCASVVAHDGIVYALGERNGGTVAVRAGGKGDVNESQVVWRGNQRARISSPIYKDGRLYWISGGVANAIDATTSSEIYQQRLQRPNREAVAEQAPEEEPRGRRRGGGGGMRSQDYSSPVVAGDRMYYTSRAGDIYVTRLGSDFEQLAVNRFASDAGEFSATPAVSNGELFIRSTKKLYCVAEAP
jgi:outer membrane protein assembly factor BamB